MNPINYTISVPTPIQAALSGYQSGAAIRDDRAQQAQQAQKAQRAQQAQQALQQFISTPFNERTPQMYQDLAIMVPAEQAAQVQKVYETFSAEKQTELKRFGGQILAALGSGNGELAAQMLQERADAERNSQSGDEATAKTWEAFAQSAKLNPKSAEVGIAMAIGAIPGGAEALNAVGNYQKVPSDIDATRADIAAKRADIEDKANRYALDKRRLAFDEKKYVSDMTFKYSELQNKGMTLSAGSEKLLNESVANANEYTTLADRSDDLAEKIGASNISGPGWWGGTSEFLKKVTGNPDAITQLRIEYTQLKNSQVMKMLPPGVASDKDVAIAREGFPPANAPKEQLATFLRGMAKLQRWNAKLQDGQAGWIAANGNLGPAKRDIEVNGVRVPKGATMASYMKSLRSVEAQGKAPERSYLKNY